jgi:hypothetical protein
LLFSLFALVHLSNTALAVLGAGLYHAFYGIPVALGVVGVRASRFIRRGPGLWVPVTAGAAVIVAALLAFGGFLYEIDDPFDNDYARACEAAAAYVFGNEP